METPERARRFTSMTSRAEIEDIELDAIIDTGAAVSAITRGLMKELGYKINQSSNVKIVNANGVKTRSLEKISDMELTVSGIDTRVTVEVIESEDSTLILGNDWLKKVKARIDMDKGKVSIRGANGFVDIPIEFSTGREENDDEEYEEEELREARFWLNQKDIKEINNITEENKSKYKVGKLNHEQKDKFEKLTQKYHKIFAKNDNDLGRTNVTKHTIDVKIIDQSKKQLIK